VIALLRRLFAPKPQRHYEKAWDGTHATCKCGHHSVWDYDLRRHFEEVGRIGA
jgi:hypothetical protein